MLDDLIFLHGRHHPACTSHTDKRVDHHALQFMAAGAVELCYDQQRHELHGPWTWAAYPGPRVRFHPCHPHQSWEHRYIAFTGPRVTRWQTDGLWPPAPGPVADPDVGPLTEVFDRLLDLAQQPGSWPRRRAINLLEQVLLERAEATHAPLRHQPAWLELVLHALSSPSSDMNYQRLAASVGMSLTTLRRHFRATTGQSLHQHRLQHRIAEARRLLGETDHPIKQIADHLGYSDVYYFTRQFTQVIGVPPAAYRRSRQR